MDNGASCPGGELVIGVTGTSVTYCFKVTNTGYTYLDVTVDDPDLNISFGPVLLAPGEMTNFYYETAIDGNLINTAKATGNPTDPNGTDLPDVGDVMDIDQAEVEELDIDCGDCTVINSGDDDVCPGTTQTFTADIDPTCQNPQYNWSVGGDGTLLSDPADPVAIVQAGDACDGEYTVNLEVGCTGCAEPFITCETDVEVGDDTAPIGICPAGENDLDESF